VDLAEVADNEVAEVEAELAEARVDLAEVAADNEVAEVAEAELGRAQADLAVVGANEVLAARVAVVDLAVVAGNTPAQVVAARVELVGPGDSEAVSRLVIQQAAHSAGAWGWDLTGMKMSVRRTGVRVDLPTESARGLAWALEGSEARPAELGLVRVQEVQANRPMALG
jgi:hypothetical protein